MGTPHCKSRLAPLFDKAIGERVQADLIAPHCLGPIFQSTTEPAC